MKVSSARIFATRSSIATLAASRRAYPAKAHGAGYQAETRDILTTTDTWFRPSDVCTAPDGSIFIAIGMTQPAAVIQII